MNNSLAFFPAPFHDETLHSILSRHCRLTGCTRFSGSLACGRHVPHFVRVGPFPCGIDDLNMRIGLDSPWTTEQFIALHTALPYYQPFLSRHQSDLAHKRMRYGPPGSLGLELGVIASTLVRFQRVRYCSACRLLDEFTCGQAYWHRVHQLPGVWVCPAHGIALYEINAQWAKIHTGIPYLPDCPSVAAHSRMHHLADGHMEGLLRLAVSSRELLGANLMPIAPERLRNMLLEACRSLGLYDGRLNLVLLADTISSGLNAFPADGEFEALAKCSQSAPPAWVTGLLHKHRSTHHPLKYLLFMHILGLDCTKLLLSGHSQDKAFGSRSGHTTDGGVRFHPVASVPHNFAPGAGCDPKLVLTTLRVTKVTPNTELILGMAKSSMSSAAIALKLGFSVTTINRTLRANQQAIQLRNACRSDIEIRTRRSAFLREYDTTDARKCSDYPWLHRNDRAWLSEIVDKTRRAAVKQHPRIDWAQRDVDLSSELPDCVARLKNREGKPFLISQAAIARELLATDWFEKYSHHLPLSKNLLKAYSESKIEYLERRMRWAAEQILQNGKPLRPSRLQRVAGIRSRTAEFEQIWSVLYCDYLKI